MVRERRVVVTGGSGFIGTHLVNFLHERGDVVLNLDRAEPRVHREIWRGVDVRSEDDLADALCAFLPTHVIHLAARTDMHGVSVADYSVNVDGCAHLVKAIEHCPSIRRAIFVSTQFVCHPGYVPTRDDDYQPDTSYGTSKARAEDVVRNSHFHCSWLIVRPTTIWGPGDLSYRAAFYKILRRGWYLHPRDVRCMRSYGYVGNVVDQLSRLLDLSDDQVAGRTLYLGDAMADLATFADAFSLEMRGAAARRASPNLLRLVARVGDLVGHFGLTAPLTTTRFRSMTEDYPVPVDRTLALVGTGPYSLEEGVRVTVAWLRANHVV